MFSGKYLAQYGLDPGTLHPRVHRRPDPITFERADRSRIASVGSSGKVIAVDKNLTLTEEEEDLVDILSPINDELSNSKSWWLLEVIPLRQRYQKKDGNWIWRTRYVRLYTELFQTSLIPLFSGPILPVAGTSPTAITTKSEYTGRLSFEWTPRKRYFLSAVDTRLELSPGSITGWNGLTE